VLFAGWLQFRLFDRALSHPGTSDGDLLSKVHQYAQRTVLASSWHWLLDGLGEALAAERLVGGFPLAAKEGELVAKAGGEGGDHIVLGLRSAGTQKLADQIGGRTLLDDPVWRESLQHGISNPTTKFSVNLNGLSGDGTYAQVMSAIQKGMRDEGATNWELLQLYKSGRLIEVNFWRDGVLVDNPFR
jgi:hypothetical protein